MLFQQLITPIGGSLALSFIVAVMPVVVVLVMLGVLRRAAWQAALAGLLTALVIAVGPWHMPIALALDSVANGAVFAMWPVMWIVVNAILLYNIVVRSGHFDAFRDWIIQNLPNDRRVVLVVIGFCFGCLLEGIAGFGVPIAIVSSLLIIVGFAPMEALVFALIFNTAPVAFGALGVPITVLGSVTGLPAATLGEMVGRQLPFMSIILPFYVVAMYGGFRSVLALLPLLLIAGVSFAAMQFLSSNYVSYTLTDVLSSMGSLIISILFLQIWRPAVDSRFMIKIATMNSARQGSKIPSWQGWLPWMILAGIVIIWTQFKINLLFAQAVHWPGLDKAISITLYHGKPYAAIWNFQPLATGTAILLAALIIADIVRIKPAVFFECVAITISQVWLAVLTVMLIIGLAYLMNYSGLAYTLGEGVASTGYVFVLLSPFLGWVAVMLSGSDTSGNALFGNLQVVAAQQLNLNPVLFAAANASGGTMGKIISPQNIATGAAVAGMSGQEGKVFARTFIHSIILTLILAGLIIAQQFLFPWMIPGVK